MDINEDERTLQLETEIKVQKQYLYCYSTFYSHRMIFNNLDAKMSYNSCKISALAKIFLHLFLADDKIGFNTYKQNFG
jgi:hypothetical protein